MATPAAALTPTPIPNPDGGGGESSVGVFWDIQNCGVPRGKSARKVVDRVRELPWMRGKSELEFLAVCDVTQMPEDTLHELNQRQVTVQHVSAAKKNSADEKLRQAMNKFVDLFGRRATLIVISSDADFLGDLADFRRRKGVTVVLLHNRQTNEFLLNVAHVCLDFNALLEDIPKQIPSTSNFTFNELEITQLPPSSVMSPKLVKQRLEDICQAHQGKLKLYNVDQRIAVLKFDQGDKATKTLRILKSNTYGLHGLQVDFNKRGLIRAKTLSASPNQDPRPPMTTHLPPSETVKARPIAKVVAVNSYVETAVLEPHQQLIVTKDVHSDLRRVSSSVMELQNYQQPPDLSKMSPMSRRRMEILQDSRGSSPGPASNGAKKKRRRQRSRRSQSRQSSRSRTRSGTSEESGESPDVLVEEFRTLGIGSAEKKMVEVIVMVQALEFSSNYVKSYLSQCLGLDVKDLRCSHGQWSVKNCVGGVEEIRRIQDLIQWKPEGMSVKICRVDDEQSRQEQLFALIPEIGSVSWDEIKPKIEMMFLTFEEIKSMSGVKVIEDGSGKHFIGRANAKSVLILPTVLITLSKLEVKLRSVFRTFCNNIPLDMILDELNAVDPSDPIPLVAPNDGGVPLEQLLDALGLSEIVHGIHGRVFVRPKGEKSKATPKNPALVALERKFLHVLELSPFHRMVWQTDFYERYYATFQERLDDVCVPFGGVESVLDQLKDTFRLIGLKDKSEITLSINYQKRVFMIALRKVLASQKNLRQGMSVDPKVLGPLFEKRLKKPFRINDFGVCTIEDLLEIMLNSKQNLFHLTDDKLHFKEGILNFLNQSVAILSKVKGYSCSIQEFDQMYTQAYGAYSIASMSFKSLKDLCSEFMHELEYSLGSSESPDQISLSKRHKLRHLKASICEVIKGNQEHFLRLDRLHDECMKTKQYDLKANLVLHGQDLPTLAKILGNETDLISVPCSGGEIALAWKEGQWLERFRKRIVFLLFHCPGQRIRISLLERLFAMTYGSDLFLTMNEVEDMLQGSEALLFTKEVSGEKLIHLHEKGVLLAYLVIQVSKSNGKLKVKNLSPQWRARYNPVMSGWTDEALVGLTNVLPGVLTFNRGVLTLDPQGSRFFLTLPKPNVMGFMEQVVGEETTKAPKESNKAQNLVQLKPSRMAATFSSGMR